jgi:DnaJ domain/Domain of unknown function (DUF5658)
MDPYKILGINSDASFEEVRQAYRNQATKYHPDSGGENWAFQQVQQAFDELRKKYEQANNSQSDRNSPRSQPAQRPHSPANSTAADQRTAHQHSRNYVQAANSVVTPLSKMDGTHQPETGGDLNMAPTLSGEGLLARLKHWLFGRPLVLHNETSYFILANFMDLIMTSILLRYSLVESNPFANYFYERFGIAALLVFKFASVLVVCLAAQLIARRSLLKARIILIAGTVLVSAVVIYSMFLARVHVK